MLANKVQDIEGNLETFRRVIDSGFYGDMAFLFKTQMITDDAALDIEAHIDGIADRSDLFLQAEFI